MYRIVLVALGGGLGSVLRYGLGAGVSRVLHAGPFPYATLVVNVLGCLVVGTFTQLVESRAAFAPETRVFVMAGLLGGFTTFSAFGNETVALIRHSDLERAIINVIAQLAFGLGAVAVGRALASWIWK